MIFSDFDISTDLLKSEIIKFDEFHLDGIQNFLLRDEIEEWNAISFATKKNYQMLKIKEEYKNYLKCVTNSITGKCNTLYLLDDENPYLVDEQLSKVDYEYSRFDDLPKDKMLIATVIENFPNKLVIYSKVLNNEVKEALKVLF